MPITTLLPPLGVSEKSFGATNTLISGCAVRQNNLRRARMQSDQRRVGPQFQRVMHDVKAQRQINGAVGGNRFLQYFGVVGFAVALGAQITQIHPGIAGGQGSQIGGNGGRHRGLRRGVEAGFDFRHGSNVGIVKPVGKSLYLINFRGGGEAFATVAQRGKNRHVAAGDAFHVDFVARVFLHPKNECRTGNVFEAGVLDPKFVRPFRLDFNGGGHMPEVRANERESGFVLQNRGFALAFKGTVNERELPAGRRF